MFCKNCGCQNPDDMRFCKNCGVELSSEVVDNNIQPPTVQEVCADTPVLAAMRKIMSSKLFLVAVILLTVSLAATVLSSLLLPANVESLSNIIEELDLPEEIYEALPIEVIEEFLESDEFSEMASEGFMSSILSQVLPILTVVGLWLCFNSARAKSKSISTTGITMISVVQTIKLVVTEILAVLFLVLAIIITPLVNAVPELNVEIKTAINIVAVVLFVFMFIVFVIAAVFNIYILKAIKSAKKTVLGNVEVKGLAFAMVFCFAAGVIGFFDCFSLMLFPFVFVSSLTSAAGNIILGLVINNLRTELRPFEKPFYANYMPNVEQ